MVVSERDDLEMVCLYSEPQGKDKTELWSFVLQAVGVPHEVNRHGSFWEISLHPDHLNFAKSEIDAFEAENLAWPPLRPSSQTLAKEDNSPFLLMLALLFFYTVTGPWHEQSSWFSAGAVSSVKIFEEGEWWRLITGLTLHADASHLLGNVFLGGTFLYFLARQVGGGSAALIALFSGFLGNGLNVLFRHAPHLSVGFSTAVFGMVGAYCIRRWFLVGVFGRELLLSLGAAFGLLALLGSGGERTDFGAHLWGMAAGILLGGIASLPIFVRQAESSKAQYLELLIFVVMVWISWYLALFHENFMKP